MRRLRGDAARTRSALRSLRDYQQRRSNPTARVVYEERNLLEWQLAVLESLRREAAARGIGLPKWRGGRAAP